MVTATYGHDAPAKPSRRHWWAVGAWSIVIAAAIALISWLAVRRLGNYRYPLDVSAAVRGAATTARETGTTAALVWTILGLELWAVGRWLRSRSDLSFGEAAAAATVLLWGGAYVALLTLGPLGLYRPLVLRGLLLAVFGAAVLAARGAGAPRRGARSWGPWIAAAAFALTAGPLLLMQLGSPVSPFMDVLPYVASTEKIVTFEFYDAFENDAAGIWPPRQVPGCDGILSLLALAAGRSARLTTTSLIVPVAALNVLAIYLVGRQVGGPLGGGMAALFLLQTFLWRRSADVRSTALAFPLIAIGLAFLLGTRRRSGRLALGALALGVAFAVNPLIGVFGMQVASLGTVVEWLDFRRLFVARALALAAACLVALPVLFINLGIRFSMAVLAPVAVLGCGLLVALARAGVKGRGRGAPTPWARIAIIVAVMFTALHYHARGDSEFFTYDWFGYPVLALLALCGLAAAAEAAWRRPTRWPAIAVPALALLVAIVDFEITAPWRFQGSLETRALASAATPKMILYWSPYWMALLAGLWFGMLARSWALVPALLLGALLVIYPVRHVQEPLDYDGAELSVAGTWGFHLTHAARGYWAGRGDRRWVLDENWGAVADALRREIDEGRIGYYTHVLQISAGQESVELALATGISVDVVTPTFNPNNYWTLGSRMRGLDALDAAFAERPPYVVIESLLPASFPQLAVYERMVERSYVHLYRLKEAGEGGGQ